MFCIKSRQTATVGRWFIETVRNDPVFGDYGRLIFPVERSYYSGDTLEQLLLTYYNNIDPDETVDICNTLRQRAADGQTLTIFRRCTCGKKATFRLKRSSPLQ